MGPEYVPKFPACSSVGPNQADWFLAQPDWFLAQPDRFLPQPDRLAATSADRVDRPVRFHRGNGDRDTRSLHGLQVPGRAHFVMLRRGASHDDRSAAGRNEPRVPLRYYALDPGFHGVHAGPAHTNRDADGADVS